MRPLRAARPPRHPFQVRHPWAEPKHWWSLWCSEWARIGIEHAHREGALDESNTHPMLGYRFAYWVCARCGGPCAKVAPRCWCAT